MGTEGADRQRVLVPIDGSPQATAALEYAVQEYPDRTLVLLHIIDPLDAGYHTGPGPPGQSAEWYEQEQAKAEALFEEASAAIGDTPVDIETAIELGRPARQIVSFAEDNEIDQIVMGSHGRSGVTRILLGSVAESVVRRAPMPVTIVR